jgi:hypothetical protein
MSRRSSEQRTLFGEQGGNSLLRQQGVQYYAALGRRSAQLRLERRQALLA